MASAGEEIANEAAGWRIRFVRTAAETGGELLEMQASYRPGSAPPPAHFHPRQEESFEVLEGAMTVVLGDGPERVLAGGETLEIAAGERHRMWNAGDVEATVSWQTRPALRTAEFLESVARAAAAGALGGRGRGEVLLGVLLMREFRDEIRVTAPPALVQAVAFPPLAALARAAGYNRLLS